MPDTGVGVALMVLKGADWKVARIFSYDHVDAGK